MCSACASSVPSAVKTAHEQSARSLMFGLYAARRSTAPISSATPVSREIHTWSVAGSTSDRPLDYPRAELARFRSPAVGNPHRAVEFRDHRGPDDAGAFHIGEVGDAHGRGDRCARPHRDHFDRRARTNVTVATFVRGGKIVERGHGQLVALSDVATVDRGIYHRTY